MLGSYRSRLITLLTAITGLMGILLIVSYMSARWLIWEDSSLYLQQTVQLYERNLASQRIELARYATMIRNDSRKKLTVCMRNSSCPRLPMSWPDFTTGAT